MAHDVWTGLLCDRDDVSMAASRFDLARFGAEVFLALARQSDLMVIAAGIRRDGRR